MIYAKAVCDGCGDMIPKAQDRVVLFGLAWHRRRKECENAVVKMIGKVGAASAA